MNPVRSITHRSGSLSRLAQIQQWRCLHSSDRWSATPISHLVAPVPPPEAPQATRTPAEERLDAKRKRAELLERGREARVNPAKPGTALQKRFWKTVSVKETNEGLQVMLDHRPVRTAKTRVVVVPHSKPQLATAIALEWDQLVSAQQALKHHYIPLTSLFSRAVDIQEADAQNLPKLRNDIVKMALGYLSTDTLLCWAPERSIHEPENADEKPRSLRSMQRQIAEPIVGYLTATVWPGIELKPTLEPDSILPIPQPTLTTEVIRGWVSGLPAFELAGLERGILASKSLLVAARLVAEWSQELGLAKGKAGRERFGIEEAAEAASVEVKWQTDNWGEVEDTHDVEKEDLRRQLGSVILLVNGSKGS
ncbi:ATP12-domain-containing protein [Eremomyces bilateralis CBS 781.70]|uniref:ATP12-domain-containing protein n=1 Tax=Eremomyces bilateralis CBS 781.70 TaxID=1392243 RepID=A0A6G1FUN3_9PEZI|nr:ATP12-domain-containing protein [Eremomyces bilateralis CBS 781.70]KAF1809517.1 ATP12-domain-containing protein [Eremomyces bilateralis CBS 781.70]